MTAHDIRNLARVAMKAGVRTVSELLVAADIQSRGEVTLGSVAISTGLPLESAAYSASVLGNAGLIKVRNTKGEPKDILISPTNCMADLFRHASVLAGAPPPRSKNLQRAKV